MFDYLDNWRQFQKDMKRWEATSPKEYGEMLANRRKRKAKRRGRRK